MEPNLKIAVILPRGMHFGPRAATSIDLCVRDSVRFSRFAGSTTIICENIDEPFDGFNLEKYAPASKARRVKSVSKIIRSIGPDLIVVHQHLPSAGMIASRFPKIPVLLHKHNFIKATKGFRRFRRYRQMARLAGLVFVSDSCKNRFQDDYPRCRIPRFVARNGLPGDAWSSSPEKRDQIIAVGKIGRGKGMVEIAEALARVLPQHPGWSARIVGPLSDEADTVATFQRTLRGVERLEWVGALSHQAVIAEYLRSRISIVNSRREAFGRVAIEAFAGGTALVSSRVGGLEEVVGDACIPLACGSSDEIAARLDELLLKPERIEELAVAGRRRFERRFTIDRTAKALDDAYCDVTGSGPGD